MFCNAEFDGKNVKKSNSSKTTVPFEILNNFYRLMYFKLEKKFG
jgi:hypothetical protein